MTAQFNIIARRQRLQRLSRKVTVTIVNLMEVLHHMLAPMPNSLLLKLTTVCD
jgi:hypothetical protein